MAGFLTTAAAALGSNSIIGSVVRIMIAYGVSRLINKNTGRDTGPGGTATDEGVRIQLAPSTTNAVPALFGSAFFGGAITDARLTNQNKTMWYAITLSELGGTKVDGSGVNTYFTDVYWNGQRVVFKADGVTVDYVINDDGIVDASPRDLVKIYLYSNGSANNRTLTDPETNQIIPSITSFVQQDARSLMPGWTHDHRMSNLTFALVRLDYNRDKGITGLPDMQFNVRNDLYRPGDAIFAYMRNARYGADLASGSVDSASLTALNDYADDDIAYIDADGTTKTLADRYQINGLINTNRPVLENLELLAQACGSYLNYDIAAGQWGVVISRNQAPNLYFDDSNIISGIQVSGTGLDALFNSTEYQFPHRQIRDKADFTRVDLPTEYRNAREPDNTLRLQSDLFNEPLQARQLAYMELYQNRMDQVITFTTDYSKINTEAGDVIAVTNDVYDWNDKEFRVIRVKEVETEDGAIAVEITAQEYDGTMYDAGGQPRRPGVPSTAITIPTLGAIATPVAPTVLTTNNQNATPSITLRSTVPGSTQANTAVIVDRMEFWYVAGAANTSTTLYKLAEISQNANGNPFTTGSNQDSQPIIGLPAGTYQFRVRAGNSQAYSDYSPPVELIWDPKQKTDQVGENTQFVPENPDLLDLLGPIAVGAMAYYAYKMLAPELLEALGLEDLAGLLGLDPDDPDLQEQIDAIKTRAGGFTLATVTGSATLLDSSVSPTINFTAGDGIEITATQGIEAGEITISATGAGGSTFSFKTIAVSGQSSIEAESAEDTLTLVAGTGITITTDASTDSITISASDGSSGSNPGTDPGTGDKSLIGSETSRSINFSIFDFPPSTVQTLTGQVFPCLYKTDSIASKQAIFTHQRLATALYWSPALEMPENGSTGYFNSIIDPDAYIRAVTCSGDPATKYIYYAYCNYNSSLPLESQAWSNWRKWRPTTVVTTTKNVNITNCSQNTRDIPYKVDAQFSCDGATANTENASESYNFFTPLYSSNFDTTATETTKQKQRYQALKVVDDQILIFGVSRFDLGDTVPFSTNTILGKKVCSSTENVTKTISFTATSNYLDPDLVAGDGTKFLFATNKFGSSTLATESVYYTTDYSNWTRVSDVAAMSHSWFSNTFGLSTIRSFVYGSFNGTNKFVLFKPKYGDSGFGIPSAAEVATSVDGITWTEETLVGWPSTLSINNHYVAFGETNKWITGGTIYSNDGKTWQNSGKSIPLTGSVEFVKELFWGNSEWVCLNSSNEIRSTPSASSTTVNLFDNNAINALLPGTNMTIDDIAYSGGTRYVIVGTYSGGVTPGTYLATIDGSFSTTQTVNVYLTNVTASRLSVIRNTVRNVFVLGADQVYEISFTEAVSGNINVGSGLYALGGPSAAKLRFVNNRIIADAQYRLGSTARTTPGFTSMSGGNLTYTAPVSSSTQYYFPGAANNPQILRQGSYGITGCPTMTFTKGSFDEDE